MLNGEALTAALAGCDAVISTLGIGTSRQPTTVYSQGVSNILSGMRVHHISMLSVVSAVPAGPRDRAPLLQRHVILPILDRVFGASYDDMHRMESRLADETAINWVVLRPPRLLTRSARGSYRLDAHELPAGANSITYADLAAAMIDVVNRRDLYGKYVYATN